MEEEKAKTKRSSDWWRGVHAAQSDEPFNVNESSDWKDGYIFEIICPTGGLGPQ